MCLHGSSALLAVSIRFADSGLTGIFLLSQLELLCRWSKLTAIPVAAFGSSVSHYLSFRAACAPPVSSEALVRVPAHGQRHTKESQEATAVHLQPSFITFPCQQAHPLPMPASWRLLGCHSPASRGGSGCMRGFSFLLLYES